jgi:hypothetical protein
MKIEIMDLLDPELVGEEKYLESLTNEDLFLLVMHYQNQKNEYFKKYIHYLDKQMGLNDLEGPEVIKYETEKVKSWKRHLLCEEVILMCFQQTTRRITEKLNSK